MSGEEADIVATRVFQRLRGIRQLAFANLVYPGALKHVELWRGIEAAAAAIQTGGDLNYMELSIAAKAYFALTRSQGKATIDEISSLMPQFGWSVGKEELEKAASFLQRANLVKQQASKLSHP